MPDVQLWPLPGPLRLGTIPCPSHRCQTSSTFKNLKSLAHIWAEHGSSYEKSEALC